MFGKKKVSIDFTEPDYSLLVPRAKEKGKSTSTIVNGLISLFFRISPDVAKKIGSFCYSQYMQEKELLETLSGFERDEAQKRTNQYERLASFFGYDTPSEVDDYMRITFLKKGYAVYPKNWIVLDTVFGPADSCMYAGVVESLNSEKFGIPHFIFFSNVKYADNYSADMEARIYEACAKAYPDFNKFYDSQVPDPDLNDPKSIDEWTAAPCFRLFHLVELGDPQYWHETNPDYRPPYGAMIVRDDSPNNRNKIMNILENILKNRNLARKYGDVEVIQNPSIYHEFSTEEEAEEWGKQKYAEWAKIHKEIYCRTFNYNYESFLHMTDPILSYTGTDFRRINDYLHGKEDFSTDSTDKNLIHSQECNLRIRIANLLLAIYSAPIIDQDVILYRQVSEETINKIISTPSYCELGFMSTSLVKTSCVENCGNHPYLLKIYVDKDIPIHAIYTNVIRYHNENELLLPPEIYLKMAAYPYKDEESGKEIYEVKVIKM